MFIAGVIIIVVVTVIVIIVVASTVWWVSVSYLGLLCLRAHGLLVTS